MQITSRLLNPRTHTRGGSPLKLEKIWFFLRKIVIFDTKYPKIFRASLRSALIFLSAPPPLTWNPAYKHPLSVRRLINSTQKWTFDPYLLTFHILLVYIIVSPTPRVIPLRIRSFPKFWNVFLCKCFHCEKRTLKVNDLESYRVL